MVVSMVASLVATSCSSSGTPRSFEAQPHKTEVSEPVAGTSHERSAPNDASDCQAPVVALDPGHNPVQIEAFDPETGAAMIDYPNGAEGANVMAVANNVKEALSNAGYTAVLLKNSVDESVSYRERVNRADQAGADLAVSIHTDINNASVFVQRVGLYREGTAAQGKHVRVEFTNGETAAKSERYGNVIAKKRSEVEGRTVSVVDNDFGGRAPLWSGNIPIIMLISENVPWVYNEFGLPGKGGSVPIGDEGIALYSESLTKGIEAALPNACTKSSSTSSAPPT